MAYRMFCGELDGQLVLSYIDHRADDVRYKLAVNAEPGKPYPEGWKAAKKNGWRVVPVNVSRAPTVTR